VAHFVQNPGKVELCIRSIRIKSIKSINGIVLLRVLIAFKYSNEYSLARSSFSKKCAKCVNNNIIYLI
jgi:hypothetical protein